MSIRIVQGDIHLIDLNTRLPFKYGIATMTAAPQAFVRLEVEVNGRLASGIAADVLPPKWFTKIAEKPLDEEVLEMLDVAEHALSCAIGIRSATIFEAWRDVYERQSQWGQEQGMPSLLSQFGATLVERAMIEAFCRALGKPFAAALRDNNLGVRLGSIHPSLADCQPREFLPAKPLERTVARHTVGIADPLQDEEIDAIARLDDGLPQSLEQCIRRYGLKHFKLKLAGNAQADAQRLTRIAAIVAAEVAGDYRLTLDGNESFRSLEVFREFWESLTATTVLSEFLSRVLFVEQPFHRDMALDPEALVGLARWEQRPRLIIDESDAALDSLPKALALGYHGTSHKNCKGVFKGIANACLLEQLRRERGRSDLIMSGEDLANIGPVALLQDLAVVAAIGVQSVERNGHHYFAGLSAFPDSVQNAALRHHPDLYHPTPRGWPSLSVSGGELNLESINRAPLGVGFELDVTQFIPAAQWKLAQQQGTAT